MAAAASSFSSPPPGHNTNAPAQEPPIIGFEADKAKIIDAMLDPSHPELSFIAISGAKGVGKTTLAKEIYASPEVQEEFDVHIWLFYSFEASKQMWLQILCTRNAHSESESESEKPKKAEEVGQYLNGKKYCLVIDNCGVNNEIKMMQHWDENEMSAALPDNKNGSRVVLAFQYSDELPFDTPQVFMCHIVGLRSQEESLQIMMEAANLDLNLNPNAPTTDADAMKKNKRQLLEFARLFLVPLCGGLPWSSRFMGALLSVIPPELPSWKHLFLQAKKYPNGFVSLALKYRSTMWYHSHREVIFSFLTFPLDAYIPAHTLYLWWIAQRIIDNQEEAYKIMEHLVHGSIVDVEERPINGRLVMVCKMVDNLVRMLAIQEAKERRFVRDIKCNGDLSNRVIYTDLFTPDVHIYEHQVKKGDAFQATKIDVTRLADATCSIFNWSFDTNNNNNVLSWDSALEVGSDQTMVDVERSLKKMSSLTPRYLGLRNPELFPEIFNAMPGLLDHLQVLDVEGTPLETMPPDLLRENTSLKYLILSNTKLREIPVSLIQNLKFLKTLNVSRAPIKTLPQVIGNLTNLQTLDVSDTFLNTIPDLIGNLENLVTLDVSGTSLNTIPEVIGNLTSLQTLNVSNTSISTIPDSIGNLTKLKTLYICCTSIEFIPDSMRNLMNLETLNVSGSPMETLPNFIGQLSYLETLDIRDTFIGCIPDLIWENFRALRAILASDNFVHLCGPPKWVNNSNLRTLNIVSVLETWNENAVPKLPNLNELGLSNFGNNKHRGVHKLENHWKPAFNLLRTLENLISLKLEGTCIPAEIISVGKCPSYSKTLTELWVGGSQSKFSLKGIEMPPRLTKITLDNLEFEENPMIVLGKFDYLKVIRLRFLILAPAARVINCPNYLFSRLERLELYHLTGLEEWWIEGAALPKLKYVLIRNCKTLKAISHTLVDRETPLQELHIHSMPSSFTSRFSRYPFNISIVNNQN